MSDGSGDYESLSLTDVKERIEELQKTHRELDSQIEAQQLEGANDFEIMGLKRKKLQIKDEIAWLVAKVTPDIIA